MTNGPTLATDERDTGQQLLHNTVRIDGVDKNGKSYAGTGFLWAQTKPDTEAVVPLVVSNKHILQSDAKSLRLFGLGRTPEGKPDYGNKVEMQVRSTVKIYDHPDPRVDVAAFVIGRRLAELPLYFKTIGPSHVAPEADPTGSRPALERMELRRATFERVTFIGYPNGLYDQHNVLPIARFGDLATQLDFDYCDLPAFLIDAAVFGGSSGSPVFVFRRYESHNPGSLTFGETAMFAGVLAMVHRRDDLAPIVPTGLAAVVGKELGLGLVFRAETVRELAELIAREP